MKIKMMITALLLTVAMSAAADFRTIQEAYEVALSDIRLPQSEAGTIAYKTCADGPYQTKRVDASTAWEVNGKSMTLEKFRVSVSRLDNPGDRTVNVLHHLERNRITKVWILIR